ncbi:MAG: hypothetical protein AB1589_10065 [Cyanobacteriota bacterium]
MAILSVVKSLSGTTIGAALLALGVVIPDTAHALTLITSRTDLGGNDSADWAVLGSPFSPVPNPFTIASSKGVSLEISQPMGAFERRNQSDEGGWTGTFTPGDALLFTGGNNQGPTTIDFDVPVLGAGTQLQSAVDGDFYTAIMEAFDSLGNSLGLVGYSGYSQFGLEGDNSAIFVGVRSDSANIDKLTLNVFTTKAKDPGFAMNRLDLVTMDTNSPEPVEPQPVPEPTTSAAMIVLGSLTVCSRLWHKRQARSSR